MLSFLLAAVSWPQTAAELSDYHRTSSYQETVQFLADLEAKGAPMHTTWIGRSTEGRPIPLVVVSEDPGVTPESVVKQGKLVVYIQANIHAGEVEGKEASLALLRMIAKGDRRSLKSMVLLVNPIYNADGNEKWGPVAKNRPEQDGPDLVGVRPNGQGLDLNRDCMKAESPEMQAALESVYNRWNPDAVLDLHTTDGTRHGYELTYSPSLNPNSGWATRYGQDELLPKVRAELLRTHRMETFDYGNLEGPSWRTFGHEGRYVTNYAGLRGAIGILSEATTFIPFKDRIRATDLFVRRVLDHLESDREKIVAARQPAFPASVGVQFEMLQGRKEDVILEDLAPGQAKPLTGRPAKVKRVSVPVFDQFRATRSVTLPGAYYIPPEERAVIRLLRRHGIAMEPVEADRVAKGTFDRIEKVEQAARAFQGHRLIQLTTKPGTRETITLRQGGVLVDPRQRSWGLVVNLLEPESNDGVAAWGFLGEKFGSRYPIARLTR